MTGLYRPEFEAALRAFARASDRMVALGCERPVLVGGAAVELYSGSAIATGDFDIVTGAQETFERVLAGKASSARRGRAWPRAAGSIPSSGSGSRSCPGHCSTVSPIARAYA